VGNFHQHLKCSSTFGVTYALTTWTLIGIDWLYGSVALLLSILGGMLPDLDSDSGNEIKHIKSISAVLGALIFWVASGRVQPPMAFEMRLWITLLAAAFCSKGIRWILARLTVHRGMFHSLPTCVIWGSIMYLYYPHENHWVRVYMAAGIMTGYMSHLFCDEYFSIESFPNLRVNKAFGTAMKFWSDKLFSTLLCYVILGLCVKQVSDVWPKGKDGQYIAIGQPSESVDRVTAIAKNRVQTAYRTVKMKGIIGWIGELLSSAKTTVSDKVDIVRENGLTKDGLKTTYTEFKQETKKIAGKNETIGTIKQLAVEAKSTVGDQVKVDKEVGADRPLQNPELTKSVASGHETAVAEEAPVSHKTSSEVEVYKPRKRSNVPSDDSSTRVIARQPADSSRTTDGRISNRRTSGQPR
jgi:membrane-bound metal-dependent hydrolase YbcI (DUF457 family)